MIDMKEYMSKYRKSIINNWGDFDREYYILLNGIDNIREILYSRYGSLYNAEKCLGYYKHQLSLTYNSYRNPLNLKGLKRICKALDISFQYAIFGGTEESYKVDKITFKNLHRIYSDKYDGKKNPNITSGITQASKGKTTSVALKYIIRIAREQGVTIDWLLGG